MEANYDSQILKSHQDRIKMSLQLSNIPELTELLNIIQDNMDVHCILCFGSYAIGLQDEQSDIDLLVIVDNIPKADSRNTLYSNISATKVSDLSKDLNHWEPSWTPVNDALTIKNQKIEIGFNTRDWVATVINKLINKNEIKFEGFPFRPYSFLGLIETSICLYEKSAYFSNLKSKIRPFPTKLKKEIVKSHLSMLIDCYHDMEDAFKRNIGILAFQYFVFMGLDAAIELIWVINDVYSPASKRTEAFLLKMHDLPPKFMDFINEMLPRCYQDSQAFIDGFGKIKHYIEKRLIELDLNPKSVN